MLTISAQIAIWGCGIVFFAGAFQAAVLVRLGSIEKKLGNGMPGIFVRRDEVALMVREGDATHARLLAMDLELGQRIHDLEQRS